MVSIQPFSVSQGALKEGRTRGRTLQTGREPVGMLRRVTWESAGSLDVGAEEAGS